MIILSRRQPFPPFRGNAFSLQGGGTTIKGEKHWRGMALPIGTNSPHVDDFIFHIQHYTTFTMRYESIDGRVLSNLLCPKSVLSHHHLITMNALRALLQQPVHQQRPKGGLGRAHPIFSFGFSFDPFWFDFVFFVFFRFWFAPAFPPFSSTLSSFFAFLFYSFYPFHPAPPLLAPFVSSPFVFSYLFPCLPRMLIPRVPSSQC